MANFGPDEVFCPNFQIAISQEPLGVRKLRVLIFQWYLQMVQKWEIMVSHSKKIEWIDMELHKKKNKM